MWPLWLYTHSLIIPTWWKPHVHVHVYKGWWKKCVSCLLISRCMCLSLYTVHVCVAQCTDCMAIVSSVKSHSHPDLMPLMDAIVERHEHSRGRCFTVVVVSIELYSPLVTLHWPHPPHRPWTFFCRGYQQTGVDPQICRLVSDFRRNASAHMHCRRVFG